MEKPHKKRRVIGPVALHHAWLIIPPYGDNGQRPYPGGIKPGRYLRKEVVGMLRRLKHNPSAIQFIADMLEV